MRQLLVSALDIHGKFLSISDLSRAAKKDGLEMKHVEGARVWDFCDDETAKTIQERFARCIVHEERQTYTITSRIGTNREHWECLLLPAHGCEVVAFGREVVQPASIDLTPDDRLILKTLADDHTVEEVATIVGQLASTVATRLKRIREKVGCKTNHGLVAWCLRYGVL